MPDLVLGRLCYTEAEMAKQLSTTVRGLRERRYKQQAELTPPWITVARETWYPAREAEDWFKRQGLNNGGQVGKTLRQKRQAG